MPGFASLDDDLMGGAPGDWVCRLVQMNVPQRSYIEALAATTGKPYMARIVGRDATYGWKREFLKPQWQYPEKNANPARVARLVLPLLGYVLPMAMEIRWGPATGGTYQDYKTGANGKLCAFRSLFILDAAGFRQATEQHVAFLLDDGIVAPGPPKRDPTLRARIRFDEEV